MNLSFRNVRKGELITRVAGVCNITIEEAPEDGILIERKYMPSIYLRWSDLDEFRNSSAVSAEDLDSWRDG